MLRPLFDSWNKLLFKARCSNEPDEFLKNQCINARKDVRDAIKIAKERWVMNVTDLIHSMRFNPKIAWKAIKTLKNGHISHHDFKNPMKFLMPNGSVTKNDSETAETLVNHFTKVFNRTVQVDMEYIKALPHHEVFYEISSLMSINELSNTLLKLTWHKAGSENCVSPNALKVLNYNNRRKLLDFITLWLTNDYFTYPQWLRSPLKVLPKKGDLLDSNN